jgi:hypothetical protein
MAQRIALGALCAMVGTEAAIKDCPLTIYSLLRHLVQQPSRQLHDCARRQALTVPRSGSRFHAFLRAN